MRSYKEKESRDREEKKFSLLKLVSLLLFLPLLLQCALFSGGRNTLPAGLGVEEVFKEGTVRFSSGQRAEFRGQEHPGMLLLRDGFEGKGRIKESFVLVEETDAGTNSFVRLASSGRTGIELISPHSSPEEGEQREQLRNFRLSMDVRFLSETFGELTIEGRGSHRNNSGVVFTINSDSFRLEEIVEGRERGIEHNFHEQPLKEEWRRLELELVGSTITVRHAGEELVSFNGLNVNERGGIELSYIGKVDIDNLVLHSLDDPVTEGGLEPGRALVPISLTDDFSGGQLIPWWKTIEEGRLAGSQEEPGVIVEAEGYMVSGGIQGNMLLPGEGMVEAVFTPPSKDCTVGISFGKPGPHNSVSILAGRSFIHVIHFFRGSSKVVDKFRFKEELWGDAERGTLSLYLQDSVLYLELNGTALFKTEYYAGAAGAFAGKPFFGYGGDLRSEEKNKIYRVSMGEALPEDFVSADFPLAGEGSTPFPAEEEGPGVFTSTIAFEPESAEESLSGKLVVEDFEKTGNRRSVLPHKNLFTGEESDGEISTLTDGGAEGSLQALRITADKSLHDYVDYRMDGTLSGSSYGGFGFSIRSNTTETYLVEFREQEVDSSVFGLREEEFFSYVPLNEEWVSWRYPFESASMRSWWYNPLNNGLLEGAIIRNISFLYPYHLESRGAVVDIDEIYLFKKEAPRNLDIGIFVPDGGETPDPLVSDIVHSVFNLNFGRVEGYRIYDGLEASSLEDAFESASAEGVRFFLWPAYRKEGNLLKLDISLCSTAAKRVDRRLSKNTTLGLDMFSELDEISVEMVNALADTNLSFRDRLEELPGGKTLWKDPLDFTEPYWLSFDGVTAFAGSGHHSESGSVDTGGEGVTLVPGELSARSSFVPEGLLRTGMLLTEPYFEEINSFSFEVKPGEDAALFLWNYRGRDSHNLLRIRGETIIVKINGYENRFRLPEELAPRAGGAGVERWFRFECRLVDPENSSGHTVYELFLDGSSLGTAAGPDLPFGRVGLGVANKPARFRNLKVEYTDR